ncbi:DUF6415 family natural product biosynthesis protein [Streptomyces sp. NPDC002018]|uniref:DUF6415 family natural product biosynthesis protein n=1 Tax=Streptomyces sp. NPDC002018 TaxID=3364629 RepID=UPI003677E37B
MTAGRMVTAVSQPHRVTLERLLDELRDWHPLPVALDDVCADLDLVLDEYADPTPGDMTGLADRLRKTLGRLLPVARREQTSPCGKDLLNRAVLLWALALPASAVEALAYLRRLAVMTLDVLELLIEESS